MVYSDAVELSAASTLLELLAAANSRHSTRTNLDRLNIRVPSSRTGASLGAPSVPPAHFDAQYARIWRPGQVVVRINATKRLITERFTGTEYCLHKASGCSSRLGPGARRRTAISSDSQQVSKPHASRGPPSSACQAV